MTFRTPEMLSPCAIAVHPRTQDIYVTDDRRSMVVVYSSQGRYIRTLSVDGLRDPYGIAISYDGNVYIADTSNKQIVVLNRQDKLMSVITNFTCPFDVAVDSQKNIYVADSCAHEVVVLNPRGDRVYSFGSGLVYPYAVAIDASNNIIVLDRDAHQITILNGIPTTSTTLIASE